MDFALIGICYDRTQTLRKGAAVAPELLRAAFPKLETYISGVDLTESFIEDLGDITAENAADLFVQAGGRLSLTKKFPIILGGEHTITTAAVKALKPTTVVIFDAHPDCEDSDGHTGILRRLVESGFKVIIFGTRVVSKKEREFMKKYKIKPAKLSDLKRIKGQAYLSIDFDILDPSILPAVGNPEPDGLKFKEVVAAIKTIAKKLVAVDFVEFTPISRDDISQIIAGKLIYAALAEIVKAKKV